LSASAVDLSGLIDLNRNCPGEALVPFNKALDIRQARLGSNDPSIASSLNNLALSYTEMGRLTESYTTHEAAIRIRLGSNSDRIANSYSNMASLLLRMGGLDEAEEMLKRCPSLKDFTEDRFLKTRNPRFSETVLFSRIRSQ
jgi:tetratricopeptide (TPR) repeat protein